MPFLFSLRETYIMNKVGNTIFSGILIEMQYLVK